MKFTLATSALALALGLVYGASATDAASISNLEKRNDLRQLYSFEGGNGTQACNEWRCACINYVPKNDHLYFMYAECTPGNYNGRLKDMRALAYCSFTEDGKTPKSINKHTAKTAGFSLID